MARPKKDGRRATGIQGKKGYLYIMIDNYVIKDGAKVREKKWISTGLADIPDNIKKATEIRERLLHSKKTTQVDLNVSLSDFIDIFLNKKKREISDTTYSAYLYRADKIVKYFGSAKVKDIDESKVEVYLDRLLEVDHVQPRTVKDIKVLFASIMDIAVKEGIIGYNPVKEVIINKSLAAEYSKEKNTGEEFFSYEEAQLFLSRIQDHELYELFYCTLFFGLRREEVLGLRWSAINFKDKTMRINHTVTKGTKINRMNTTKTAASDRTYPLTDEQIELFMRLKNQEDENRRLFGRSYKENDYIFKHEDGSLFYPDYPTKAFGKVIKRNTDLPQSITFHGLRTSCVSILVHEGRDIKSIQEWVGHADIDTTLRIYAKVKEKEAKREVSNTMSNLIPLNSKSE